MILLDNCSPSTLETNPFLAHVLLVTLRLFFLFPDFCKGCCAP